MRKLNITIRKPIIRLLSVSIIAMLTLILLVGTVGAYNREKLIYDENGKVVALLVIKDVPNFFQRIFSFLFAAVQVDWIEVTASTEDYYVEWRFEWTGTAEPYDIIFETGDGTTITDTVQFRNWKEIYYDYEGPGTYDWTFDITDNNGDSDYVEGSIIFIGDGRLCTFMDGTCKSSCGSGEEPVSSAWDDCPNGQVCCVTQQVFCSNPSGEEGERWCFGDTYLGERYDPYSTIECVNGIWETYTIASCPFYPSKICDIGTVSLDPCYEATECDNDGICEPSQGETWQNCPIDCKEYECQQKGGILCDPFTNTCGGGHFDSEMIDCCIGGTCTPISNGNGELQISLTNQEWEEAITLEDWDLIIDSMCKLDSHCAPKGNYTITCKKSTEIWDYNYKAAKESCQRLLVKLSAFIGMGILPEKFASIGCTVFGWLVEWKEDIPRGTCRASVSDGGGICVPQISEWISSYTGTEDCQTNTIIFFVVVLLGVILISRM